MPETLFDRRFELKELLGRSDLGELYLATDATSGEMLALKRFGGAIDPRGEDWLRHAGAVRRGAELHHPHLLLPTEVGVSGGRGYQVAPYFPAAPLPAVVRGGALKLSEIVQVVQQVAEGLAVLHRRGLVHGNLKPSNILVSRDEAHLEAVSCDPYLNQLRGVESALLREGLAPWHAPEVAPWLHRAPDARADLYVLGTLAYGMLTGRLPFSEGPPATWLQRRLTALPPPPREWNAHVPERLSAIVMRLLARHPDERFPSAEDLVAALREWARPEPEPVLPGARAFAFPPGVRPTPGAGREGAREALLSAFSATRSGRGALALLSGDSGSGRATVAGCLRFAFESASALVLGVRVPREGWCAPFQVPAELFQELLRRWVYVPDMRRRDLLYGLHRRLGEHAALWTAFLPESATLLPDAGPLAPMPPERQRLRMLSVLADTFAALASPQAPLVLAVEGLERIDADSLDWLRHLFHRLPGHPILIMATVPAADGTESAPWAEWLRGIERHPALLRIPVPPLTLPQTAQAVAAELGIPLDMEAEPLRPLVEALHGAWRGHALAQALTLDLWRASGRLAWRDSLAGAPGWHWAAHDSTGAQPETLSALVEDWLDQLPEPLYQVLEPAAVLPGAFALEGLAVLLPDIPLEVLVDRLDGLVERGALEHPAHEYRFLHARLREAVYRRIAPLRRRAWHQAAGAHEEAGTTLRAPLARRVHAVRHFEAGEELTRAVEQGFLAAEEARHHHALHAACREYEALLATLGEDARAGAIFAALGESRAWLGEIEPAQLALDEALRRAPSAAHQAETLGMLARVALAAGRRDEALSRIEEALRLLGESLPARPMGTVLARLATGAATRYQQLLSQASGSGELPLNPDEERLARLLELASLTLGQHQPARATLADERILGLSAGRLASPLTLRALIRLGADDPTGGALDEAATLAEARHLPHEAARVRLARARVAWRRLETESLQAELAAIAEEFRTLGDPLGEAESLVLRLHWCAWQGPAAAISEVAGALRECAALAGAQAWRDYAEGWLAFAAAFEGHRPATEVLPALTRLAESPPVSREAEALAGLWRLVTELYLLAGQPQSALSAAQQGLRAAPGEGDALLRALLAEALLAASAAAQASGGEAATPRRDARRLLRALSTEARAYPLVWAVLARVEVMDDALDGNPDRAAERAREGLGYLDTHGLRIPAAWLAFRAAQVLKQAGHAEWLAWGGQALTRFDALGAQLPRLATRRLLELADEPEPPASAGASDWPAAAHLPEGLAASLEPLAGGTTTALPRDVLRWLAGACDAERAALFLADADGAPALAVTIPEGTAAPPWINRWLVDRCWQDGVSQRMEHYPVSGEAPGGSQESLSVLCVPLRREGRVRGAVYFASPVGRHIFGDAEQLRALALADQGALALALAEALDALRDGRDRALREAREARDRAEWALAVSTLGDAPAMLEAYLRDLAEPRGFGAAVAFLWNRDTGRLEPLCAVTRGRTPLGAFAGVDLRDEATRRVRDVLERQQPGALRGGGNGGSGWEAGLLGALDAQRGLWLPLVSRGESEGAVLLGGSGGAPASLAQGVAEGGIPGATGAERDLLGALRSIAPLLLHAGERERLARLGSSRDTAQAALEEFAREAHAFLPAPLRGRLDPGRGARVASPVTDERAIAIAGEIRGWEGLSASGAEAALPTLDEYLAQVEEALALHHARLDYVRDGAWLARGEGGAESALWAAQAVIVLLRRWRSESERPWPRRLRTGIGLHIGAWSDAFATSGDRREAMAIGAGPTVARELARLNFRFHTDVLVSQALCESLAEPGRFELRALGSQRLGAGTQRVRYHEYYGTGSRDTRERMLASRRIWEDALRLYREGTWGAAAAKLREYLAVHPEDRPARLFLRICRSRMA